MTATYADILESDVFAALRTFILALVDCEVVRGQVNRVATPKGDFIALNPVSAVPLETNTHTFGATQETVKRPMQFTIQVDCYGAKAGDRAATLATLLRDDYAVQSFAGSCKDITPLYADDAHEMPLVDGEQQFEARWTFNAVLQANPTITLSAQTADTLTVGTIDVDRSYPP